MAENPSGSPLERRSKGQIIILVALVFVALILFVGLVVDVGMVLAGYAQLRRTVDAAAVQGSNQFREFRKLYNGGAGDDMYTAALQVAAAQGFAPPAGLIRVFACTGPGFTVEASPSIGDPDPPGLAAQLCTTPPRKLVRVDGRVDVPLPFLSLVGWNSLTLRATSVAEAAALELVLVLDRSSSMAFDNAFPYNQAHLCSPTQSCYPFEDVRTNSVRLVSRLYFPYDRVAIVTFSRKVLVYDPVQHIFRQITNPDLKSTTSFLIDSRQQVLDALNDNALFNIDTCSSANNCHDNDTEGLGYSANTNTGGAIRVATSILGVQGKLRGSVWLMLLLSDGAPNVTDPSGGFTSGYCPPSTWSYGATFTVPGYSPNLTSTFPYAYPYCRRANVNPGLPPTGDTDKNFRDITRVCVEAVQANCAKGTTEWDTTYTKYDPADYMRDMADYMGENGIVAFAIGLGAEVSNNVRNQSTQWNCSVGDCSRDRNAGERLLRYVADVGTQPNSWECHSDYWNPTQTEFPSTPPDHHCGNYWFAATGSSLQPIFDAIANRIFTRITQ
jgi:hypothetical protein